MKKQLTLIILASLLVFPMVSSALELNYPTVGPPGNELDLNAIWDDPDEDIDLNELVGWLYYFIIGISGLAAFAMLVMGGFQWMSSVGNPTKISDAKDRINSALLGLIIILMSWLILNTINPELTVLRGF